MQTGPSREELQNYWKNNREYFDSLAKYYQQTDPEYYKEYIAPFYTIIGSAMRNQSSGPSGAGTKIIIAAVLLIIIGAASAGVLYLVSMKSGTNRDMKKTETLPEQKDIKGPTIDLKEQKDRNSKQLKADTSSLIPKEVEPNSGNDDYETGLKYFNKADFENAKKYFELVPKGSKKYTEAQKKLYEIRLINDALDSPEKKDNNKEGRVQPKERLR